MNRRRARPRSASRGEAGMHRGKNHPARADDEARTSYGGATTSQGHQHGVHGTGGVTPRGGRSTPDVPGGGAGEGIRTDGEPWGCWVGWVHGARSIRWTRWTRGGARTREGIHRRTLRRRLQGETRTETRRGEEESVGIVVRGDGGVGVWTVCT